MAGLNWVLSGVIAAAVLTTGGCGGSPEAAPLGSGCLPPPFSLSADTIQAGGKLTVTANDATCDPRYGADAQILLEIIDGSGEKIMETFASMNDAGGFSADINVPESAVPGQGAVNAYPWNLDWCDDTGKNNRVGQAAPSGFERASCVMPSEPLTITP